MCVWRGGGPQNTHRPQLRRTPTKSGTQFFCPIGHARSSRSPRLQEQATNALVVREPLPTTESDYLAQIHLVEESLRTKEQSVQEAKEALMLPRRQQGRNGSAVTGYKRASKNCRKHSRRRAAPNRAKRGTHVPSAEALMPRHRPIDRHQSERRGRQPLRRSPVSRSLAPHGRSDR